MNGSDEEKNLVLLTAREHFICHWLLVKRYNQNTNERKKMLFAFHKMCFSDPNGTGERINNSRTFEKYKNEFYKNVSSIMKDIQTGTKNNQYGKHWYTNRDTGECKSFSEPPNEKWIAGRNLFKNETSFIPYMKNFKIQKSIIEMYKIKGSNHIKGKAGRKRKI